MKIQQTLIAALVLLATTVASIPANAMDITVQGEGKPPVPLEEILIPYPYSPEICFT